MQDNSIIY